MLKREAEKVVQKNHEQSQKIQELETKLVEKEEELKRLREEQHQFDVLLRNERDKVSNMGMEVKSLKVEQDLIIKEKQSEINQL